MGTELSRQPAGIPAGGQFASRMTPEAGGIDLREVISDDDHNRDGTLLFPPAPRSARQAISFWMTVEIPEHTLARIYVENRRQREQERARRERVNRSNLEEKSKRQLRKENFQPLPLEVEWPEEIPEANLRAIVRLSGLARYSEGLPPGEKYKVMDCRFTLDNGESYTPEEVVRKYNMNSDGMDEIFKDGGVQNKLLVTMEWVAQLIAQQTQQQADIENERRGFPV